MIDHDAAPKDGVPGRLQVVAAGCTPVKGTRHLNYDTVRVDEHGPVGDRVYCLVDVANRRILRTVQNPGLVAVTARLDGNRLTITLPGGASATAEPTPTGEVVGCDYWSRPVEVELLDEPHSELLSRYLQTSVRLAAAPRGAVVFADPVTVLNLASLRDLAARTGQGELVEQAARFRPTVVIDGDLPAYAEEAWAGSELRLGDVGLRIGGPIPRCAVIDLDPATGRRDRRLLKALATHRPKNTAGEPFFGVYAQVVSPGRLIAV